jgi:predicted HTH transcriptional regulator
LPYELTTQQLYKPHKSHPNNPLIAEPLQRSGFIEKAGTGTGEIVKLCLQHGLKKPLFEQDGDFKVIIWRPGTQDGTQDGTQNGTQNGTQKQLEEKIISLIKANPKISRKDIATATQTSPRTIARRIKEMNDKIRFVGSGYSGHWEVIKNS